MYTAWQAFSRGKRRSPAFLQFQAQLEANILQLSHDLTHRTYYHGEYQSFVVRDPKRREIAVATIRDRAVHRLLYDYLVKVWDSSFCYDAWSCRKNKGLLGAIERAQLHLKKYQHRAGCGEVISQGFFDSID